jgi:hypothetical protein
MRQKVKVLKLHLSGLVCAEDKQAAAAASFSVCLPLYEMMMRAVLRTMAHLLLSAISELGLLPFAEQQEKGFRPELCLSKTPLWPCDGRATISLSWRRRRCCRMGSKVQSELHGLHKNKC